MADWESKFSRIMRSDPRTWTPELLASLSGKELSGLCELMGIAVAGTINEKITRLMTAAGLRGILACFEDNPQDLCEKFKLKELQAMCVSVGVFRGTNKYQAAAGLLNWRNECRRKGQRVLAAAQEKLASRPLPAQLRMSF